MQRPCFSGDSRTPRRLGRAALLALPLAAMLAGCAPQLTNTTYSGEDLGRTAQVSFGTIVAERPVTVQAENSGVGTFGGAALGGTAGSFIGGSDVRGNILGAVGGAIIGGLAGTAIESQTGHGNAVEFVIRQDDGQTVSVVQTNELQLAVNERVAITRGARTRLARLAPPPAYPQPAYPQPGYPQPGYPQPGYPQQAYPQPPGT